MFISGLVCVCMGEGGVESGRSHVAQRRGNSNSCASKADVPAHVPKGPHPWGKSLPAKTPQADCTLHFLSFLGSQFKSHDDFVSSWHIFFLITHRFQRRGLWLRRAGEGESPGQGLPMGRPWVVAMETGIIRTKQRHVAWQQRSWRFITHTLHTYQGTPGGGSDTSRKAGVSRYPRDDESQSVPGFSSESGGLRCGML